MNLLTKADRFTPVIRDGIPDITPDNPMYEVYWKEQIKFCKHGYVTDKGEFVNGRLYFYLNFCKIDSADEDGNPSWNTPFYTIPAQEFSDLYYEVKENSQDIIIFKSRDVGFSTMWKGMIAIYDYLFTPLSTTGLGFPKGEKGEGYMKTARASISAMITQLPDALKLAAIVDNEGMLYSGYRKVNAQGRWEDAGSRSRIIFRQMVTGGEFRSEDLTNMVFEEIGEFEGNLIKCKNSTDKSMKRGRKKRGVMILGGTTNKTSDKGFKEAKQLWFNPVAHNLVRLSIPKTKMCFDHFNPSTGVTDEEAVRKEEMAIRDKMMKDGADDMTMEFRKQENPLDESEYFINFSTSAAMPLIRMNEQLDKLRNDPHYVGILERCNIKWSKSTSDIFKVEKELSKSGEIEILYPPQPMWKNLDVGGVDTFFYETSTDKDRSEGVCTIYRRADHRADFPTGIPVARYQTDSKKIRNREVFYENCAKLASLYHTRNLVEYDENFISYHQKKGWMKLLLPFQTASGWRYGVHMKEHQKIHAVNLIIDYFKREVENIMFKEYIEEGYFFGDKNTDNLMSLAIALMHDEKISHVPIIYENKINNFEADIPSTYPQTIVQWRMGKNGIPVKL